MNITVDEVKDKIMEYGAVLLYKTTGAISACDYDCIKAKRILNDYEHRVIGVYDNRAKSEWIQDDINYALITMRTK